MYQKQRVPRLIEHGIGSWSLSISQNHSSIQAPHEPLRGLAILADIVLYTSITCNLIMFLLSAHRLLGFLFSVYGCLLHVLFG